jgi:hypothetical protein
MMKLNSLPSSPNAKPEELHLRRAFSTSKDDFVSPAHVINEDKGNKLTEVVMNIAVT